LSGEGIDEMVLVHDFQLDPVSDVALHVDFLALTKGEKVSAEVSIVMIGDEESSVVKSGDGSIQLVKDSLAIEALPKDLIREIEVNVSDIEDVNTVLFVKDLTLPSGVEIKDDLDLPVISVFDLKK
jgi:large subunit ribosomal protein L25